MHRWLYCLWFLMGCAQPSNEGIVKVEFHATKDTAEILSVAFRGAHRLLSSDLPDAASPGENLPVQGSFAWGKEMPAFLQLGLWRAGAAAASAQFDVPLQITAASSLQRLQLEIPLSESLSPGNYWVMASLTNTEGTRLGVDAFPGNQVVLGVVRILAKDVPKVPPQAPRDPVSIPTSLPTLVVGGDVNLGRRQNGLSGARGANDALQALPLLQEATLAYVNLESVISNQGTFGIEKGESGAFYYRGRPEQTDVLGSAGIDVVGTANNHSGDYGPEALLHQHTLLKTAGIADAGSGNTLNEACKARHLRAGDLQVAFLTVDTTQHRFAATSSTPGACFVNLESPGEGRTQLEQQLATARKTAHLVLVGVHWGKNNKSRPTRNTRAFARWLVTRGVDGVLGSSAHRLQGVEIMGGKPIIYDAGNLLFDSHLKGEDSRSALFELFLTKHGIEGIAIHPVDVGYGRTQPATGNSASRTLRRFSVLSKELGTHMAMVDGTGFIDVPSPDVRPVPEIASNPPPLPRPSPPPPVAPPSGCLVNTVPAEAALKEPVQIGPFELLGVRLSPQRISSRQLVWLESFWRISAPVKDHWFVTRLTDAENSVRTMWWADHEPCDWQWPSSRWVPGQIYRDYYSLRAPSKLPKGAYRLRLGTTKADEKVNGFEWTGPTVTVD